jgi:hypothetical protein
LYYKEEINKRLFMREINKKVYELAGIEFDESSLENPPTIDTAEVDTSAHSIDQILTDQQLDDARDNGFKQDDFDAGKDELEAKVKEMYGKKTKKVIKATGGGTKTGIRKNLVNQDSEATDPGRKVPDGLKSGGKKAPAKKAAKKAPAKKAAKKAPAKKGAKAAPAKKGKDTGGEKKGINPIVAVGVIVAVLAVVYFVFLNE